MVPPGHGRLNQRWTFCLNWANQPEFLPRNWEPEILISLSRSPELRRKGKRKEKSEKKARDLKRSLDLEYLEQRDNFLEIQKWLKKTCKVVKQNKTKNWGSCQSPVASPFQQSPKSMFHKWTVPAWFIGTYE